MQCSYTCRRVIFKDFPCNPLLIIELSSSIRTHLSIFTFPSFICYFFSSFVSFRRSVLPSHFLIQELSFMFVIFFLYPHFFPFFFPSSIRPLSFLSFPPPLLLLLFCFYVIYLKFLCLITFSFSSPCSCFKNLL